MFRRHERLVVLVPFPEIVEYRIFYNEFFFYCVIHYSISLISLQFISNPLLSNALGVEMASFHVGLIAFGLLYSPISEVTSLVMNQLSRKFEYQADDYAKNTYKVEPLVTSLKKLSKNSLSNLTPHPAYVLMHYSHPTLLERVRNLNRNGN